MQVSNRPTAFLHDKPTENEPLFNQIYQIAVQKQTTKRGLESMYQLSLCYYYAIGVARDLDLCCYWFKEAAISGHLVARASITNVLQVLGQPLPSVLLISERRKQDLPTLSDSDNVFQLESLVGTLPQPASDTSVSENTMASIAAVYSNGNPLHHASVHNLVSSIHDALPFMEEKLNEVNDDGETPLYLACCNGNGDVALLLLAAGADASISNNARVSPLHWLIQFEDSPALETLLSNLLIRGAMINAISEKSPPSGTSFHHVMIQQFLENGTPLTWATALDKRRVIEALLRFEADPWLGMFGPEKGCAIVVAVLQQQTEVLNMLLDAPIRYPNPNIPKDRLFLLRLNQWIGEAESLLSLAIKCCQDSFLHIQRFGPAFRQREQDMIGLLLRRGANHRNVQSERQTALCHAVRYADLETVKFIVSLCGSGDVQIVSGEDCDFSPLQWAVYLGKDDIFSFLLDLGADCFEENVEENTLLHIWAEAGRQTWDLARHILELGIPLDSGNSTGLSALGVALTRGNIALAEFLSSQGADFDFIYKGESQDYERTVLGHIIAANSSSCLPALSFLLGPGTSKPRADFVVRPCKAMNVFHIACLGSELKADTMATRITMKYLLEAFSLPEHLNAVNKDGYSPLHVATLFGNHVAATMLLENGADVNMWTLTLKATPLDVVGWRDSETVYCDEREAQINFQRRRDGWEVYRQEAAAIDIELDPKRKQDLMMKYEEVDHLVRFTPEDEIRFNERTMQMRDLLVKFGGRLFSEMEKNEATPA